MHDITKVDIDRCAQEINGVFRKGFTQGFTETVEGFVEAGRLLLQYKGELPHGSFEALTTKLDFHPRTARRLMAIARNPVLSKRTHGSVLPPSIHTLSLLARIPDAKLLAAIKAGTINPGMERGDVKLLADDEPLPPEPKKPKKPVSRPRKPVPRTEDEIVEHNARAMENAAKDPHLKYGSCEDEKYARPGDTPEMVRVRGLLWRSGEAIRYANHDDLVDLRVNKETLRSVQKAAEAWAEVLSTLVARQSGQKGRSRNA